MVEIKANLSVQIPGGPQLNATQILKLESYRYFDITLDGKKLKNTVILTEIQKLSLILVKVTSTFAQGSTSKLEYQIGSGTSSVVDTPLLLLGSWIRSMIASDELKLVFDFKIATGEAYSKDSIKVEIITGWPEVM
jgi:hypothetical protein